MPAEINISGYCAAALFKLRLPLFRVRIDGDGSRLAWATGPSVEAVLAAYREKYRGDWQITAEPAERMPHTDSGPCGWCVRNGCYAH